jgi:hypothetical protein
VLPHRLPAWARAQCPDPQLLIAESQPPGVRLVLMTRATDIELDVLPTRYVYRDLLPRPHGLYDLLVNGELFQQCSAACADVVTINVVTGAVSKQSAPLSTLRFTGLPHDHKQVDIWLPHNEVTHLVALRTNAPIEPDAGRSRKVWVHQGSSISHGSNGDSPTLIWPALAASRGNVDLFNLALGGSALLDPFVARVIRDMQADLIRVKIGINLVNHASYASACIRARCTRLSRHHSRRPSHDTLSRCFADLLPDSRRHARPPAHSILWRSRRAKWHFMQPATGLK